MSKIIILTQPYGARRVQDIHELMPLGEALNRNVAEQLIEQDLSADIVVHAPVVTEDFSLPVYQSLLDTAQGFRAAFRLAAEPDEKIWLQAYSHDPLVFSQWQQDFSSGQIGVQGFGEDTRIVLAVTDGMSFGHLYSALTGETAPAGLKTVALKSERGTWNSKAPFRPFARFAPR
jgi:hypothetical protein